MLDALTNYWRSYFNTVLVSYATNGLVNHVEVADDCVTIYTEDNDGSSIITADGAKVTIVEIPYLYQFFLRHRPELPTSKEIFNRYYEVDHEQPRVECNGHDTFVMHNIVWPWPLGRRHQHWHNDTQRQAMDHSHYASINGESLQASHVDCLLNKVLYFNEINNETYIHKSDIRVIVEQFKKRQTDLTRFAEELSKTTINSFIYNAVLCFLMDFMGRYLLPCLVYRQNNDYLLRRNHFFFDHAKLILTTGRVLLPLIKLFTNLMLAPSKISSLAINSLATLLAANNYKFIPKELLYFLNLSRALTTGDYSEQIATKVGSDLGVIFGGASAFALGTMLSQALIRRLPKLKDEPKAKQHTDTSVKQEPDSRLRRRQPYPC